MNVFTLDKHLALFAPELKEGDQDARWVHEYAKRVLTDEIPACKWVKLAAKRHFNDLDRDDVYFDMPAASKAIRFFKFIPITDGVDAGKPTILMGWQIFLIASLFGWKRKADGLLKYRQTYIQVARKNGKTTLAGGITLLKMLCSGYKRPRAYSVASKKDQARELFEAASSMINLSPRLRMVYKTQQNEIKLPKLNGYFKPLASDSNTLDGLNPLIVNLDEVHSYKNSNLYSVMVSALGAQPEPLMISITTAGFELNGVCKELNDNGKSVLSGLVDQDSYFYMIFEVDDDDDWQEESCWYKANPALGYHLRLDYLRERAIEASMSLVDKHNFYVKHLNRFTTGGDAWLDMEEVKDCRDSNLSIDKFRNQPCYVGIDKSLKNDLTSICLLFPTPDGGCATFHRNYLPEYTVGQASILQQQVYRKAIETGDLTLIPGKTIRDEFLKEEIKKINHEFSPKAIAYDAWKMGEIAEDLEDLGFPMLAMGQQMSNMSEPSTKLEALIKEQRFKYNCNVFEYCCTNAILKINGQGNVRVEKDGYANKIDTVVATVIALSCAILNKAPEQNPYLSRGVLTF